jgi:hypothetical protein
MRSLVKTNYAWVALFAVLIAVAALISARAATVQLGSNVTLTGKFRVMESNLKTGVGMQEAGATGTVVGGPVKSGTRIWWRVDFASGADGWVVQSLLTASGSSSTPVTIPASLSFTANASTISAGGSVTLSWSGGTG